jgi:CHAD domain-containing protein
MADDRWLSDLRGDMPVSQACQIVLEQRLGLVRDRLPLAREQSDQDIEHVHQLRVATRRAGAAVRIFGANLSAKLLRRTRRQLRSVRRAAGAARDWDVFTKMVAERRAGAVTRQQRGLEVLLGFAQGQRAAAQDLLLVSTEKSQKQMEQLLEQIKEHLGELNEDPGPALKAIAQPTLRQLVQEIDAAVQGNLLDYDALHQVRILGKQLRYAMELFGSCFAPAFREEFYPAIVQMQDILGEANDSHVAAARLGAVRLRFMNTLPEHWTAWQPGIDALMRAHQRRLPEARRRFEKWWARWQASGAENSLKTLLKG